MRNCIKIALLKPLKTKFMLSPANCIPVAEARELRDNWLNTRQPAIDTALGYPDQNVGFYSIDELQEYLNYVRVQSIRQNIPNPGVRIYFAAYNNEESNLATIFVAPTDGPTPSSNNNYNIRPLNNGNNGMPPTPY